MVSRCLGRSHLRQAHHQNLTLQQMSFGGVLCLIKKIIPRFTHAWHRQKGYSLLLNDNTQAPVTAPHRPAGPTLEQLKGLGYVEFSMSPHVDVQNIDFDTKIYCVTPYDTFGPFSAMVVDFGSSLLPKMSLIGQEDVIDRVVDAYNFDDRSDALAYLTDVLYHAREHEPIRFMIEKSSPLRDNIVTLDEKMTGEVYTVHHYETDEAFSALVLDDGVVYSVYPMSVNASDCVVLDDGGY